MRNDKLLSFYFFLLFIYNSASCAYLTVSSWSPWYLSIIPLLMSFFVAFKYNVSFIQKKLVFIIGIFALWNVLQITINHVPPSPYALILIIIAWVVYNVFYDDFSDRFVSLTAKMATLSLIVWILCLIIPSFMHEFGRTFGIDTMNTSYSFIIFNIPQKTIFRNAGFCWEPGRYSCILLIALYFHYIRNGGLIFDRTFIILIVSLISTLSTTGFIGMLIFVIYHIFKSYGFNPLYWSSIGIIAIGLWALPFMGEKIQKVNYSDDRFKTSISELKWITQNRGREYIYTPQRLEGLAFQLMNVEHMNPLIGDGHNYQNFYINKKLRFNIVSSEGLLYIVLCYGLFLAPFFYFYLIKSSYYWGRMNETNANLLFFLIFIVINISYFFWEYPLFMPMWLWSYYESTKLES